MPNRQIVNGEPYRYAFQGQEKDPETGKEAFQLRLWDGRIGRWLTVDPKGQYHSPYMGMGNNPTNGVDPDGGCFKDGGGDCDLNAAVGTKTVGSAGNEWTMKSDGWARSDGFELNLGSVKTPGHLKGGTYYLSSKEYTNGSEITSQVSLGASLYGIAEGAAGTIEDFDQVVDALEKNTFLSRKFNKKGNLNSYQLNKNGVPTWNRPDLGYTKEMVHAEAKRFKFKAGSIKLLKVGGIMANSAGVIISIHDLGKYGYSDERGLDLVVGMIGFQPGYGWVIVTTYTVSKYVMGKTTEFMVKHGASTIPLDMYSIHKGFSMFD